MSVALVFEAQQEESSGAAVEPLAEIRGELSDAVRRIEGAFTRAGASLVGCVNTLNGILSAFESLGTTLTGPELREACSILAGMGSHGEAFIGRFSDDQRAMRELIAALQGVKWPVADLASTVEMIAAVAINARVVAAGMHVEGDGLEVFTTDIADLTGRATGTVHSFQARHLELLETARDVDRRGSGFEMSYRSSVGELTVRLNAQLEAVAKRCEAGAAASAEVGEMSRDFRARVSNAVLSLQIGDNVRQRIEHVVAAIEVADAVLSGKTPAGCDAELPSSAAARGHIAQAVLALQSAQIAAALAAIRSELASTIDAVSALSSEMRGALRRKLSLFDEIRNAEGASLADLQRLLAELALHLKDCATERRHISGLSKDVDRTVNALLEGAAEVRDVEFNMRLLSFNTAIKCHKAGEKGRALAVISQQLRELTGEMVVRSEAAANSLVEVERLAKGGGASKNSGLSELARLEEDLRGSLGMLRRLDGDLEGAIALLSEQAPEVERLGGEASAAFEGQSLLVEDVAAVGERLNRLVASHGALPADAGEVQEPLCAVLSLVRARYTMAEERNVHDALFGKPAVAAGGETEEDEAPAVEDEGGGEGDADDFLF